MTFEPSTALPAGPLLNEQWLTRLSEDTTSALENFGDALALNLYETNRTPTLEEIAFLVSHRPQTAVSYCLKQLTHDQLEWLAQTQPFLMLTEEEARNLLRREHPELLTECIQNSPSGALLAALRTRPSQLFSETQRRDLVLAAARWIFNSPDRARMLFATSLLDGRDVRAILAHDPGALLQCTEIFDWVDETGKLDQAISAAPADAWTYASNVIAQKTPQDIRDLALQAPAEAIRYGGSVLSDATYQECFAIVAQHYGYSREAAQLSTESRNAQIQTADATRTDRRQIRPRASGTDRGLRLH